MNPLVSIIVPSFQQAEFLRDAIDSILSQDYQPIEVLVFDGGSSDGSKEILESYGDRIWFRSGPDGGQCSAINEGFRKSRGEFVAWINSDDFYYPGAIAHAVQVLTRHPEAVVVYGDGNLVTREGNLIWKFPEPVPFDLWRMANHSDYILQPTTFFRRDLLFQVGLLDEGLNWSLDWDLWIRLGKRFPFVYTERLIAAARIYGETKTTTGRFRRLRETLGILGRHGAGAFSPAALHHATATLMGSLCKEADLVTPEVMLDAVPGPLQRIASPLMGLFERTMRRWLQNVQGVWRDNLVSRHGKLWLPSDGRGCYLEIEGRNMDIAGQRVRLRSAGRSVVTPPLASGEPFTLRVEIPAGRIPVQAELFCARTVEAGALDPRLGKRRAGCRLEGYRLVPR